MSDSTTAIASWEDASTMLVDAQSSWETINSLGLAQTILALIPIINVITGPVQWVLCLVNTILFMDFSTNLTSLATYYNNADNWSDKKKYDEAQTTKKTNYLRYNPLLKNEKEALEFEAGDFAAAWNIMFYVVLSAPLAGPLVGLAPFTFGLSLIGAVVLFATVLLFNVLILAGFLQDNGPSTILSWMPTEKASAEV